MNTFKRLNYLCRQCSILISGLIKSLKVSKFQGLQYKIVKREEEDFLIKWIREHEPEKFKKYYNPQTKQIEFWRIARDSKS